MPRSSSMLIPLSMTVDNRPQKTWEKSDHAVDSFFFYFFYQPTQDLINIVAQTHTGCFSCIDEHSTTLHHVEKGKEGNLFLANSC